MLFQPIEIVSLRVRKKMHFNILPYKLSSTKSSPWQVECRFEKMSSKMFYSNCEYTHNFIKLRQKVYLFQKKHFGFVRRARVTVVSVKAVCFAFKHVFFSSVLQKHFRQILDFFIENSGLAGKTKLAIYVLKVFSKQMTGKKIKVNLALDN